MVPFADSCLVKQCIEKSVEGAELIPFLPEIKKHTFEKPCWIHLGSGNIFRSFIAELAQKLIKNKYTDKGIIVADTYDGEIIEKIYKPYDNLFLSCVLNPNGNFDLKLISSVTEALAPNLNQQDLDRFFYCFTQQSLQIVSLSVTEKAYELYDVNGNFLPWLEQDLNKEFNQVNGILSLLLRALQKRFDAGKFPLTLLAFDNCYHNGDKLKHSIYKLAELFLQKEKITSDFYNWITSDAVSFPLSMIDKITPHPTLQVQNELIKRGFTDIEIIKTAKNSVIAPFVNSEPAAYLVIEDNFCNGRPDFEKAGVIITSRENVILCENMKIETCLNPLQTALAIFGILFEYKYISDCVSDPLLHKLVVKMVEEGMAVVQDPHVINPKNFADEVINLRLPNKYIFDQPYRIATDSTNKINIRCGLTIKKYGKANLNKNDLVAVPLVIAAFIRYLQGTSDVGNKFELASDLKIDYLKHIGKELNSPKAVQALDEILSNEEIIGCNLKNEGMYDTVKDMYLKMQKTHGIKSTLAQYLS